MDKKNIHKIIDMLDYKILKEGDKKHYPQRG